jgi:hypothetical protein
MINYEVTSEIKADATRHLCAGVFLDRAFRNMVIRKVHNDPAHRTAPSYGFDLVAVVRKAWQAWVLETVQLAAVLAVLITALTMDSHAVLVAACGIGMIYLAWTCLQVAPEACRLQAQASAERFLRRGPTVDHARRRERSRLITLCGAGCVILLAVAVSAARTTHDPAWQLTVAGGLLGVLTLIGGAIGVVRQIILNRVRWGDQLRPESPTGRLAIIDAQQKSEHVIYRGPSKEKKGRQPYDPDWNDGLTRFVGGGILVHRWLPPLNIQLLRPGEGSMSDREYRVPPFQAHELVEFLKKAMEPAGEEPGRMHGFQIEDRLYVDDTEVASDRRFLRVPCRQQEIDDIIDDPHHITQHRLEIRLTVSGEVVTTVFARVSVRGRSLSLDFAACALTRTPPEFHLLDNYGETGAGAVVRSAIRGVCAIPVTVGGLWRLAEVPWILARAAWARKDRTLTPRRKVRIGTRISIREEAAAEWAHSDLDVIAIYDDVKIIEQRLLKATEDFLEARDVDVTVLKKRAFSIINTGFLNMGRLDMNQSQVRAGNQSSIVLDDGDVSGNSGSDGGAGTGESQGGTE